MTTFPVRRSSAIDAFTTRGLLAVAEFRFDERRTLFKQMLPVRMGKTLNSAGCFRWPRIGREEPTRKTKGRTGARKRIADRAAWKARR